MAVTGMAGISPIGCDWATISARLRAYRNAIVRMDEWGEYRGPAYPPGRAGGTTFDLSDRYKRKSTRSMGRVALMATRASELALIDAGLLSRPGQPAHPLLTGGMLGIAYGSSAGTPKAIGDFGMHVPGKIDQEHQRHHLYQDDVAYGGGQHGRVLRRSPAASSPRPAPAPRAARASAMHSRRSVAAASWR